MEKPLIVTSAVKSYVKEKNGLRSSEKCSWALHRLLRQILDHAILRAESEKRTTLMERDFDHLIILDGRES